MVDANDELTPLERLRAERAIQDNAAGAGDPAQTNENGAADAAAQGVATGARQAAAADQKGQTLAEGSFELGGVKKITREELTVDPQSAQPEHVVQQGGGGVVRPSGEPLATTGSTNAANTPTETGK